MKKPLTLTLIAALTLSACATKPPPGAPVGYLVGSLGYEPEGRKLERAELLICSEDRQPVADLSYKPRRRAPGAIDQPGFAGESFVVALAPGTYYFCGSDFAERITDPAERGVYPSFGTRVGDVALGGAKLVAGVVVITVLVVGVVALVVISKGSGSSSGALDILGPLASGTARPKRTDVALVVEAGKLSYIGRYRGFQQAPAVDRAGISTWVVTDAQAEDLVSVLKQRPDLTDVLVVTALPGADVPAGWKPAAQE
jgi:hypothetical protein